MYSLLLNKVDLWCNSIIQISLRAHCKKYYEVQIALCVEEARERSSERVLLSAIQYEKQ